MKFVFFGYDFMLGAVQRLLKDGHQLMGTFTFPCDNVFNFNAETAALAQKLKIPVTSEKPAPEHIDFFLGHGCECFLSAGYPYRIPPIVNAYGINLHPSLLPLGRGIMPTPHIIMNHPEASGLTVHKLSEKFDEGDILHQTVLPLGERETVETLSARIALRGRDVLSMIMSDLPTYWNNAKPQNQKKATYFPPPDDKMRMLDWTQGVKYIDKTARAFGRYGSLAQFENTLWVVYAHDAWEEKHNYKPGSVVTALSREIIIAAKDGFVCLKEFQRAQTPS